MGDIFVFLSSVWQWDMRALTIIEEIKIGKIEPEAAAKKFFNRESSDSLLHCFLYLLRMNEKEAIEVIEWVKGHTVAVDEAFENIEDMFEDKERCKKIKKELFSKAA